MDALEKTLQEARSLPDGPVKAGLLEEAIRIADSANDLRKGYDLRLELFGCLYYTQESDKYFPLMAWMLAQIDRDPTQFRLRDVLWVYKWVLHQSLEHPELSVKTIRALKDDFARRAKTLGVGRRTEKFYDYLIARHLGHRDQAAAAFEEWSTIPRDWLSDCAACEANRTIGYASFLGDHRRAVEAGQKLLRKGMGCGKVPHSTYAGMLMPLFLLGRHPEAEEAHAKGYEMVQGDEGQFGSIPEHLEYLALSAYPLRGKQLLERHWRFFEENRIPDTRYQFARAAVLWLRRLEREGETVSLNLPASSPQELLARLEAEALEIARRFDRRNANTNYSDKYRRKLGLLSQVAP